MVFVRVYRTKICMICLILLMLSDYVRQLCHLNWWRRRELNPRPEARHSQLYMFIPCFLSRHLTIPMGEGIKQPALIF